MKQKFISRFFGSKISASERELENIWEEAERLNRFPPYNTTVYQLAISILLDKYFPEK